MTVSVGDRGRRRFEAAAGLGSFTPLSTPTRVDIFGWMTRRVVWAAAALSMAAAAVVPLAPAAHAAKLLEAYKSNTKELKSECADGGGDYVGSKTGRLGTCMWPDGSNTTCDNKKKGKNCSTFGRVVTDDGEFLDFVGVALADPSSVTVVPGDGAAADGRKEIRRLLGKEDFEMSLPDLEAACTDVNADLITRNNDSRIVCVGRFATIFCDPENVGKSCTIEAVKKGTRSMIQLLQKALVDPSSVTIVLARRGGTPSARPLPEPTTTEPSTTTTEPSTTTSSTEPPPAFL